ncbi:WD repeat-containing protein, putative [Plasmodium chabaudi chabaudi]|uniref:WD repeat-containing protein, putative n=1 Tax=Plasmodium chabaudi chabaudi TaxID=31271 RepID=A0A1D3S4B6_PLACU|nr:WD repeat-containing protein, putative [Plasmodium chabaudi chabaudi]
MYIEKLNLSSENAKITSLDFQPNTDLNRLAISSLHQIKIYNIPHYDVNTKNKLKIDLLFVSNDHNLVYINTIRWSYNGKFLASCDSGGTLVCYELDINKNNIKKHNEDIKNSYTKSGNNPFAQTNNNKEEWKMSKCIKIHENGEIFDLSWSRDNEHVVCGVSNGIVYIFNLIKSYVSHKLFVKGTTENIKGVSFHPTNNLIFAQSSDNIMCIWKKVNIYSDQNSMDMIHQQKGCFDINENKNNQTYESGNLKNDFSSSQGIMGREYFEYVYEENMNKKYKNIDTPTIRHIYFDNFGKYASITHIPNNGRNCGILLKVKNQNDQYINKKKIYMDGHGSCMRVAKIGQKIFVDMRKKKLYSLYCQCSDNGVISLWKIFLKRIEKPYTLKNKKNEKKKRDKIGLEKAKMGSNNNINISKEKKNKVNKYAQCFLILQNLLEEQTCAVDLSWSDKHNQLIIGGSNGSVYIVQIDISKLNLEPFYHKEYVQINEIFVRHKRDEKIRIEDEKLIIKNKAIRDKIVGDKLFDKIVQRSFEKNADRIDGKKTIENTGEKKVKNRLTPKIKYLYDEYGNIIENSKSHEVIHILKCTIHPLNDDINKYCDFSFLSFNKKDNINIFSNCKKHTNYLTNKMKQHNSDNFANPHLSSFSSFLNDFLYVIISSIYTIIQNCDYIWNIIKKGIAHTLHTQISPFTTAPIPSLFLRSVFYKKEVFLKNFIPNEWSPFFNNICTFFQFNEILQDGRKHFRRCSYDTDDASRDTGANGGESKDRSDNGNRGENNGNQNGEPRNSNSGIGGNGGDGDEEKNRNEKNTNEPDEYSNEDNKNNKVTNNNNNTDCKKVEKMSSNTNKKVRKNNKNNTDKQGNNKGVENNNSKKKNCTLINKNKLINNEDNIIKNYNEIINLQSYVIPSNNDQIFASSNSQINTKMIEIIKNSKNSENIKDIDNDIFNIYKNENDKYNGATSIDHTNYINKYYEGTNNLSHHINSISINMNNDPSKVLENLNNLSDNKITKFIKNISPNKKEKKESKKEKKKVKKQEAQNLGGEKTEGTKQKKSEGKKEKKNEGKKNNKKDSNKVIKGGAEMGNEGKVVKGGKMGKEAKEAKTTKANKGVKDSNETAKSIEIVAEITLNQITEPNKENVPNENNENNETNDQNDQTQTDTQNAPNESNEPNEPNESNEPNEPNEPNGPNESNEPNEPTEPNDPNDPNEPTEENNSTSKKKETSKSQKRNSNKGTKRKSAKNNKKDENGNNSDIEWENFNPHAELFCPIIRKEDNEEEVGYMTYSSPVKFGKETNDSNDLNKQNKNKKRKSVDNINKKKSKNSIEFLSFNDTNENGDNECLDKIMKYNKYEEGEKRNSKIKNENSIFKTEETFDNTKNKEYEEDDDTVENVLKKNSKRMYENMYNSSSVIDKQNYNLKNAHNNLNSSNKYTGEKFMKREAKNSSLNNSTSNIFGRNDYPNEFEAFEIGKEKKKNNNNIYLDNYELSQRNLNNKMSPDYYNHNSHSHLDKYSSVENGQDEANNYHTKKFRSNENENYKYHQSYLKREHNTNLNLIDIKKEEFENGSSMYSQEEYNDPTERYGYNSNEFDKYKEMNFKNKKRKAYNKMINGNTDNFDINNVYGSNNIDFIRTKKYNDKMNYISKGYNKRSNKKIRIKNNEDIETVYESNQYILDDMYSNDDIIYSNHGEKKKKMKYIHITNDVQYEKYKNKVIIFDNRKENCLICCMCNNNNNLGEKKNYYLLWEDEISGKNIKYTINDNYIFIISYKFNIFLFNIFSINSKLLIHDYVLPVKYIADFVIIKSFNIDGNIYTFFYIHDKKYYYIYQLLNYSSLFLLYSFEISMLNSHVESININIVEKLQNEAILSKSSKKCFKKYKKLFKNRNKKGSIDEKKIKENREENESSEVENDKPTNSETEQTKVTVINKKRKEKNEKDKEKDLSLKELIHSITFYEKLKIGNKSNVKQHKKCNGFFSKKSIKKGKHQYNMSHFHPGGSNKLLTRIPNKIQNFSSQKEKKTKDTTNKEKTKKNYFDIFSNNIHGNDLLYDYIYRKENFYYSYMCIYIFLKNGMIFLLRRNLMKTEVTNENHLPDAYPSEVISMRPHMFEQNGITLISRLDNIYYNKSLYCDIDLLYNSKNDCSDGIHNKAILGTTNTLNRCLANEYFNESKNLIMFDNLLYIQQKGMKNFSSQNKIFNIYDFDISKLMESEDVVEEHETVGHYFDAVVKEEKVNTDDDDDNINKYDKIESNKNNFVSQNRHIKKELNIVSDDFLRAMNISEAFKKNENNSTSHIDTNIYIKTIKYLENQMKYSILIMNKKSFLNYLYAYFSFLVEYLDITRIQQNFQYFMKITLFHLKKYISNFVFFNIDQDTNHEPYWLDTNALLCMNIHFFFLSLFLYYNFLLPIYKILRQKKKKNTHIHKYHSFFRFIKEMHKCMVQIDTVFQRAFHRSLSL